MSLDRSSSRAKPLFFAGLAAVYILLFFLLRRTPFFDVTDQHNDRLFSADDVYYATEFFSAELDDSPRIIKHPLLIVIGCALTRLERLVFGAISIRRHYELIVLGQMLCSVAAVICLDALLEKRYGVDRLKALMLCAIYACSFSTLFYTFTAESYILSSLLLLLAFTYAPKNMPITVLLGVLTAGVTITNAFLWALIVVFSGNNRKKTLLTLLLGGLCFCAAVAVLPIRHAFFGNIFSGALNSAKNYSDHYSILEMLRRGFFIFFGSTTFWLDTADSSPFGDFQGDALSFLPSAPGLTVAAMVLWCALLLCGIARARKDRLLAAPLSVLLFSVLLHGVIGYGIKEGFLYSLHHFSAQILIIGLAVRGERKKTIWADILLAAFLLAVLTLNLPGYRELAAFLNR